MAPLLVPDSDPNPQHWQRKEMHVKISDWPINLIPVSVTEAPDLDPGPDPGTQHLRSGHRQ